MVQGLIDIFLFKLLPQQKLKIYFLFLPLHYVKGQTTLIPVKNVVNVFFSIYRDFLL